MQTMPASPWPIFTGVADYKGWRRNVQRQAILDGREDGFEDSVGFVPTMGALHQGHLDLVKHSMMENRHTVVSIFVNPAQFAPTEDLASYPRTLEADIEALNELESAVQAESASSKVGRVSAIFCPSVKEMYPPLPGTDTPFTQDVSQQQGAFVEVKGLGNVLEGKSRPGFFRGVATVVTKLWHIVEPTRVYFGQKDIQQAIILRALATSLLFSHPSCSDIAASFRLIPTRRDDTTGLALSSRNAYLSDDTRARWAPELYRALGKAREVFEASSRASSSVEGGAASSSQLQSALAEARSMLEESSTRAQSETKGRVRLSLDYLEANTAETLEPLTPSSSSVKGAVLSGAMWIEERLGDSGKERIQRTRMIDNILLGTAARLLSSGAAP
ncbi:unnamed protein product [Parajaminaea phylloscopi]